MTITQRAYDKIGDLLEQEEAKIKEELSELEGQTAIEDFGR